MADEKRVWPWHDSGTCPECKLGIAIIPGGGDRLAEKLPPKPNRLGCPACGACWYEEQPGMVAKTRRAHAWWNRIADGEITEEQAKQEVLDQERKARLKQEAEAAQVKFLWGDV